MPGRMCRLTPHIARHSSKVGKRTKNMVLATVRTGDRIMSAFIDPKNDLVVDALRKSEGVLALAHTFLSDITRDDSVNVWELHREACAGLGDTLYQLRYSLRELAAEFGAEDRTADQIREERERCTCRQRPGGSQVAEPEEQHGQRDMFVAFLQDLADAQHDLASGTPVELSPQAQRMADFIEVEEISSLNGAIAALEKALKVKIEASREIAAEATNLFEEVREGDAWISRGNVLMRQLKAEAEKQSKPEGEPAEKRRK